VVVDHRQILGKVNELGNLADVVVAALGPSHIRMRRKQTPRNAGRLAARATVGRELGLFDYVRNYVLRRYDNDLILGDKEFVCPNLRYLLGHERWKGPQFDLGRYFLANPDFGAAGHWNAGSAKVVQVLHGALNRFTSATMDAISTPPPHSIFLELTADRSHEATKASSAARVSERGKSGSKRYDRPNCTAQYFGQLFSSASAQLFSSAQLFPLAFTCSMMKSGVPAWALKPRLVLAALVFQSLRQ
jgi:hypothetical protein